MPKSEEELKALKERFDQLNDELKGLSEDELMQVTGGGMRSGLDVWSHGESGGNGGSNG